MENTEYFELEVEIKFITPAAVLVSDGDKEGWIPRSQIDEDAGDPLETGFQHIFAKEWILKKNGFI